MKKNKTKQQEEKSKKTRKIVLLSTLIPVAVAGITTGIVLGVQSCKSNSINNVEVSKDVTDKGISVKSASIAKGKDSTIELSVPTGKTIEDVQVKIGDITLTKGDHLRIDGNTIWIDAYSMVDSKVVIENVSFVQPAERTVTEITKAEYSGSHLTGSYLNSANLEVKAKFSDDTEEKLIIESGYQVWLGETDITSSVKSEQGYKFETAKTYNLTIKAGKNWAKTKALEIIITDPTPTTKTAGVEYDATSFGDIAIDGQSTSTIDSAAGSSTITIKYANATGADIKGTCTLKYNDEVIKTTSELTFDAAGTDVKITFTAADWSKITAQPATIKIYFNKSQPTVKTATVKYDDASLTDGQISTIGSSSVTSDKTAFDVTFKFTGTEATPTSILTDITLVNKTQSNKVLVTLSQQDITKEGITLSLTLDWTKINDGDELAIKVMNENAWLGHFATNYQTLTAFPVSATCATGSKYFGVPCTTGIFDNSKHLYFEGGKTENTFAYIKPDNPRKNLNNVLSFAKQFFTGTVHFEIKEETAEFYVTNESGDTIFKYCVYYNGLIAAMINTVAQMDIKDLQYSQEKLGTIIEGSGSEDFDFTPERVVSKDATKYNIFDVKLIEGKDPVTVGFSLYTLDGTKIASTAEKITTSETPQSVSITLTDEAQATIQAAETIVIKYEFDAKKTMKIVCDTHNIDILNDTLNDLSAEEDESNGDPLEGVTFEIVNDRLAEIVTSEAGTPQIKPHECGVTEVKATKEGYEDAYFEIEIAPYGWFDADALAEGKAKPATTPVKPFDDYLYFPLRYHDGTDWVDITTIEDNAFANNTTIQSVEFTKNFTSISPLSFYKCTNLEDIYIDEENTTYEVTDDSDGISNCLVRKSDNCVIFGLKTTEFKGTIEWTGKIGPNAFKGVQFNETTIQLTTYLNISSIGKYAFQDTNLTSFEFKDSSTVSTIEESTFNGCTSLNNIVFNDYIKFIDPYAFNGCTGLNQITLPTSIITIDNYAFNGCTGLIQTGAQYGILIQEAEQLQFEGQNYDTRKRFVWEPSTDPNINAEFLVTDHTHGFVSKCCSNTGEAMKFFDFNLDTPGEAGIKQASDEVQFDDGTLYIPSELIQADGTVIPITYIDIDGFAGNGSISELDLNYCNDDLFFNNNCFQGCSGIQQIEVSERTTVANFDALEGANIFADRNETGCVYINKEDLTDGWTALFGSDKFGIEFGPNWWTDVPTHPEPVNKH